MLFTDIGVIYAYHVKNPGFGPVDTSQSPHAHWKTMEFKVFH